MFGEGALRSDCSGEGVAGASEGDEERIALGVDLLTTRCRDRRAHDPVVLSAQFTVKVAMLLHESRRPLDVREQERDSSARKLGHATSILRLSNRTPEIGVGTGGD
jgi:hypothetical protein